MQKAYDQHPVRVWPAAALAAVILYLAYLLFVPFFVPLFWGAVLGALFYPLYRRLLRALRGRAMPSAGLMTLAVLALVLLPAIWLGFVLVSEAIDLFGWLRAVVARQPEVFSPESITGRYVLPFMHRLGLTQEDVRQAASMAAQAAGSFLVSAGSKVIGNVVVLIVDIFLTLVALYYAFKDGPLFLERLVELVPLPREEARAIAARLGEVLKASVFSTFAVAIAQGAAGGVCIWIIGLSKPLLWGVGITLASLVPVAGAPLVWVPAVLYLLATGDYGQAIGLTAAGVVVIGTIDNFLRPVLIHGRVHIHNFYLFFGILGGVYLMGFTGFLLGPILVSLALAVLRIYEERRNQTVPSPASEPGGQP